jgi:xylose isomerase-like TIM barrel protein
VRSIGFSTGALARSDFKLALFQLEEKPVNCVELSALRFHELRPLLESLSSLALERYLYISVHAPSQFQGDEELETLNLLRTFVPKSWPIVVHPDAITEIDLWRKFGNRIAIENMDRRKPVGRTAEELKDIFADLPEARLCFDIGHARQFDTTMTEAYRILRFFADRLCQIHISEVNSASQHDRLSFASVLAFEQVASMIPESTPIIVESRVTEQDIESEIEKTEQALSHPKPWPVSA